MAFLCHNHSCSCNRCRSTRDSPIRSSIIAKVTAYSPHLIRTIFHVNPSIHLYRLQLLITMKFTQIVVLLSSSITLAQPFGGKPNQPDASDEYPSPTKDQLREISWRADGTLSNAPLPAKLGDSSKTAFQALAFGEEF